MIAFLKEEAKNNLTSPLTRDKLKSLYEEKSLKEEARSYMMKSASVVVSEQSVWARLHYAA